MKQKNFWVVLMVLVVVAFLVFYFAGGIRKGSEGGALIEQPLVQIQIAGPVADRTAELSGLAWYGDNLILLPQYPNVFEGSRDGFLYYLPKDEINAYLDGADQSPLEPHQIQLIAPELAESIPNYQGFESIAFSGERVFMTIEAGEGTDMQGYLISGTISTDLATLYLDTSNLALIPPQAKSDNHTDESILILDGKVITFYEVIGESIVSDPVAHVFDFDLKPLDTISMINLEYRLTDTAAASGNEFWGINYFFPGDDELTPVTDPIADKFGKGSSQAQFAQVERLVKFQYSESGITLADTAPVSLSLVEDARNWEGLVLLDERGFLMATDKFPTTILGFVPMP